MPNLLYLNEETAITWLASGGTNVFTPTSVASGAGRQGAYHDFGVAARSDMYAWRAWFKFATTPVIGEAIDIYLPTSDGTSPDNNVTGDAAVSSEDLVKYLPIWLGRAVVQVANTSVLVVASGTVYISARYVAPAIWNATADALSSTAADHGFSLTPVPMELQ